MFAMMPASSSWLTKSASRKNIRRAMAHAPQTASTTVTRRLIAMAWSRWVIGCCGSCPGTK